MKYKFVPDVGVNMDWRFEGLTWELACYDQEFYMDGGQFSILVDAHDGRSRSSKPNRQGVFVEIAE